MLATKKIIKLIENIGVDNLIIIINNKFTMFVWNTRIYSLINSQLYWKLSNIFNLSKLHMFFRDANTTLFLCLNLHFSPLTD